jgi:GTP cyclohydrolase I
MKQATHPSDPGHPIKLNHDQLLKAAVTQYPSPIIADIHQLSDDEKITYIAERYREIMIALGLDISDPSLARTPFRVAKMYVKEVFSGLDLENFPDISLIEDCYHDQKHTNIVFVKVSFHSFCEHHFVPMSGTAYISYVPNKRLIGLSKIPRIVRFFSQRPQVQERLNAQIADSLSQLLDTENVAVSLIARHFCVIARGIEDNESHTITNVLRGEFKDNDNLRREFFEAINRQHCD